MTNESKPVDIDREKAAKLTAGPPVEAPALSVMGSTFAERAAASKQAQGKQVDKDADEVEDKAVSTAETKKRTAPKSSAKKG